MTAEHDDLLRTETAGGYDAAETHCAITDDGGHLAGAHIRPERRVMASAMTSERVSHHRVVHEHDAETFAGSSAAGFSESQAKLGIHLGSLVSAVIGIAILLTTRRDVESLPE